MSLCIPYFNISTREIHLRPHPKCHGVALMVLHHWSCMKVTWWTIRYTLYISTLYIYIHIFFFFFGGGGSLRDPPWVPLESTNDRVPCSYCVCVCGGGGGGVTPDLLSHFEHWYIYTIIIYRYAQTRVFPLDSAPDYYIMHSNIKTDGWL